MNEITNKIAIKKQIILFFLLLFCLTAHAQNQKTYIRVDTSYFPFKDDIQMIQIEYTYVYSNKQNFNNLISDYNYSYNPIPDENGLIDRPTTKYIFRNKKGEIITTFNNYDQQRIHKNDFRLPDSVTVINDSILANLGRLFVFYQLDSVPAKNKNKIGITRIQNNEFYTIPTIEYYGRKGLINRNGEVVLEPIYDDIYLYKEAPIVVKDGKIGFLNPAGKPITPVKFKDLFYNSYGYIRNTDRHIVAVDSLVGIIDSYGNTVLDFDFKSISLEICKFDNWSYAIDGRVIDEKKSEDENVRYYFVTTKEGKKAFIKTSTLEYAIPLEEYDSMDGVSEFNCNGFFIRKGAKYGYVNKMKVVIPIEYDTIIKIRSNKNSYLVKIDNQYGLYDQDFTLKIVAEYDSIIKLDGGYLVQKDGKYGFYNQSFDLKTPISCDTILEIKRMYGRRDYIILRDNLYGIYDKYLELKTPVKYDTVIHLLDNRYLNGYMVRKDNLYGFYDLDFKLKLPLEFDTIFLPQSGYITQKDNLYGYYDNEFNLRIPALYHEIRMTNYDEYSLYDKKPFYFVKEDSLYAIFNEHFQQVTPFKYDEVEKIRLFFKVRIGANYTILNSQFKAFLPPILVGKLEPLVLYQGEYYQMIKTKDGKYGILGMTDFFLKPKYDEIRYEPNCKNCPKNYNGFSDYIYFQLRKGKKWKTIKVKIGE